jgi:1,4-dihydroxy-6-naphthoate synthase
MKTLSIGHSPDADDAFMFYGLASERVIIDGFKIDHVMEDIETLNRRARRRST